MDTYIQREPGYPWHLAVYIAESGKGETFCGMRFLPERQTTDRLIALPAGVCRECESEAYHEAQLALHDG